MEIINITIVEGVVDDVVSDLRKDACYQGVMVVASRGEAIEILDAVKTKLRELKIPSVYSSANRLSAIVNGTWRTFTCYERKTDGSHL